MKFRAIVVAIALAAVGAGSVSAAGEPQVVRQELMKSVGGALGALSKIAKGESPYDAAVVTASLKAVSDSAKAFPDQFPAGSEAGFESEASPEIWAKFDDFKAKSLKLAADADALLAAVPADAAGVGAALNTLGPNCGACHQVYRLKK